MSDPYTLSSGHFSTDIQLQDVVNWLESEMPVAYAELLAEFPELLRALATITGTSSWVDCEEAGVDIEYTSWAIDWIESHTPVAWWEGEPWSEYPDAEEDE